MYLTVGQLRNKLKGLDKNMPVYTMDHDHSEWETNGHATVVTVRNQDDMDDYAKARLEEDDGIFKIKGDYLTIKV